MAGRTEPITEPTPENDATERRLSPRAFRAGLRSLAARTPFSFPETSVPDGFRRAALLIPFWETEDDIEVALIRRAQSLRTQPGMVVFAGGMVDRGESFVEAALREANEEIGLDLSRVEIIGRLDDAWSGFDHHLAPVVVWLSDRPALRANPAEVDEVLVASVSEILRPESRSVEQISVAGLAYTNVTLRWQGGEVDRLSAELLLEAIEWAHGGRPSPGPDRLKSMLEKHETLREAHRELEQARDSS